MLVQYTSITSLNEQELQALKSAVLHMTLEGRGQHFQFGGKTFNMSELIAQKRIWEGTSRGPGQPLFG